MEKPDIVTLLGDNITHSINNNVLESIKSFYSSINQAIDNTILTMTIGNHDISGNNHKLYLQSAVNHPNILLNLDMDETSVNYIVLIHLYDKPILALAHVYTHIDKCRKQKPQGCPSNQVIKDLNHTIKSIKASHADVQVLLVTHIPSSDVASLVMDESLPMFGILGTKLSCPDNFSIIDEIDHID